MGLYSVKTTDLDVGLERGKIIGGASFSFIAFNTSSLKSPPQAERPVKKYYITCLYGLFKAYQSECLV